MNSFFRSSLLLILSTVCLSLFQSCKEKIDPAKVSLLKQTTDFMEKQNNVTLLRIQKNIRDQGNLPADLAAYERVNTLLMKQQDTIILKSNYLNTIIPEYKKSEQYDTNLVRHTQNFYTHFSEKKDSLSWYYYRIGLLAMEREIINTLAMYISSPYLGPLKYVNVFSSSDSLKINKEYTLIITPAEDYLDDSDHFIVHLNSPACVLTCNNKPVSLPLSIRQYGYAYVIHFTPRDPGTYKIDGDVHITLPLYAHTATNHFTKTLYVE